MPEGFVSFIANGVNQGNYYWLFSTIVDDYILDPGEFYNYYPDQDSNETYFVLGEGDIANSAVTLVVNKTNVGLSMNNNISDTPIRKLKFKVKDYNSKKKLELN